MPVNLLRSKPKSCGYNHCQQIIESTIKKLERCHEYTSIFTVLSNKKKPGINKWRFFSSKLPIHNIKSLWFYLGNNFCSCTGLHILSRENCYKNCGSEMNSIKSETSDGAFWKLSWKISFCLWDYIFRKRPFTFPMYNALKKNCFIVHIYLEWYQISSVHCS